jgi:hypothetical protein
VSPAGPSGTDDAMSGCSSAVGAAASQAAGFEAFGTAASPQTGVQPAFWSSVDGRSWAHRSADPLGAGLPSPALAVERSAAIWMAATRAPGPDLGSAAPLTPSGLWVSTDSGNSWAQVDTSSSVWQGQLSAHLAQVAMLGTYPVVAGQVDGRLTVWLGVPT